MQTVFEAEYLQLQAGGFLDLLESLSPRNPAFTKYVWEVRPHHQCQHSNQWQHLLGPLVHLRTKLYSPAAIILG